ncbi:carbamoyltransferase N-terminal domain-containing protein, partial [Amycolatopsis lurida]|uniref:carbamoyltransferase N-terminal domain-containing protein n=1 Tax=Amycolatopsis lurida TaxID=31959 RepID=UPI003652C653
MVMRVIGISGMDGAVEFKRREMPGLDSSRYRIVQGLDSAAALVTDEGVVAAAAEERFTGKKATGDFPVNAIRFCLRKAGLSMSEVDRVAHGFAYRESPAQRMNASVGKRFREVYSPRTQQDLLASY